MEASEKASEAAYSSYRIIHEIPVKVQPAKTKQNCYYILLLISYSRESETCDRRVSIRFILSKELLTSTIKKLTEELCHCAQYEPQFSLTQADPVGKGYVVPQVM